MATDVLDVMAVPLTGDPAAVYTYSLPGRMAERGCDVLVVGGGTGGVAAALAVARQGWSVILLEETDWIGGQLTAQGVAALDEHDYIEIFGGTRTWYALRDGIRDHYLRRYPLVADRVRLNPGNCWVTRLAFEPRVALGVLRGMVGAPAVRRRLSVELRTKTVAVETSGDRLTAVVAVNLATGTFVRYRFRRVVDATELGDLLPLAGVEHTVGAETRAETGEPHAQPQRPCPDCVQSLTYPAVVSLGARHRRSAPPAPPRYAEYRDSQPYSLRIHVTGGEIYGEDSGWRQYGLFETLPGTKGGLWTYRRLVDSAQLGPPARHDITILNWPGNDYRDRNLLTLEPAEQAAALQAAKWVSRGFLHWLRTEAPNPSGGTGFPDVGLEPRVYGTADGLSKYPYIRESRRIVPVRRVLEQDVSVESQQGAVARRMPDSAGVGWYPIDIHGAHPDEIGLSVRTRPFQIPLGALVPLRVTNLVAAAKNIGTTHITNGCYRLHPVEWNIGEAAGIALAESLRRNCDVQALATDAEVARAVQAALIREGVPLSWLVDVPVGHLAFTAVQEAALDGRLDPAELGMHACRLPAATARRLGITEIVDPG